MEILKQKIIDWIKGYATTNNLESLVVGVSGGIDSAVVSFLCCLTGLKTLIVSLPIHQKQEQLIRARSHSNYLKSKYSNVVFIERDLTSVFEKFSEIFTDSSNLSLANTRSRLRMTSLYHISSENNGIVVGTGNKVEDFGIGFFTKYGDGGVDISPIADLTKTEVRLLATHLGINEDIIQAPPTDGLWEDDRTDEDQIGCGYEDLEWAMKFDGNTENLEDSQKKVLQIYNKFHKMNKHKMVPVPIFTKDI